GRTINIAASKFYLLNAFAELQQKFSNCTVSSGISRGQDVQSDAFCKMQFEFGGILVGWHVCQLRRAVGFANRGKSLWLYRESDSYLRNSAKQSRKLLIVRPAMDCLIRQITSGLVNLFCAMCARALHCRA